MSVVQNACVQKKTRTYVPCSGSEGGLVLAVVGVEVEAMGMVTSAAQNIEVT